MNNIIYFNHGYRADLSKNMNQIGEKLLSARRLQNLKQTDISERLLSYGVDISAKHVSKWENGDSIPNAYQFLALCCVLNLDPSFLTGKIPTTDEIDDSDLNAEGKQLIREFRNYLVSCGRYVPGQHIKKCAVLVSRYKASAGLGFDLQNGDDFESVMVPENRIPAGTDFGVRVDGDSMEPVYHDGQIVWIKQTNFLNPGDVGLFILENKGYIKVFDTQTPMPDATEEFTDSYGNVRPQPVLISYNDAYAPRVVLPHMEFRICGKVLS